MDKISYLKSDNLISQKNCIFANIYLADDRKDKKALYYIDFHIVRNCFVWTGFS